MIDVVVRSDKKLVNRTAEPRLLLVELQAPRAPSSTPRAPVAVSLVVDRSGSMAGDKLKLALDAARQAIRALDERDRFSVVVFDDRVDLVVPATGATRAARQDAEARLESVTSRGNTDLCGGWLTGCAQIGEALPDDA